MKRTKEKNESVVQLDGERLISDKGHLSFVGRHETDEGLLRKPEKLWFVQFGQVRRHSRVLYLPLDPTIVQMYKLKKGDVLKFMLLELRRAPAEDEPISDAGEL